ncbi:hypothetical protein CIK05_07340 [Bdellovibrio sp. qaytius]|nr:hypothetical protein CIK05_07340 [Bdellovibrio sp. qaytius]
MEKNNSLDNNRNYQPMKPDPTKDPENKVMANRETKDEPISKPPTGEEIGSSIVRRNEADDED